MELVQTYDEQSHTFSALADAILWPRYMFYCKRRTLDKTPAVEDC